jgi:hypothetical protein
MHDWTLEVIYFACFHGFKKFVPYFEGRTQTDVVFMTGSWGGGMQREREKRG